ncbi:MAG TPA: hypothetical protein VF746_04180 [Longimicrobium sp.]|jgi:hypothetical protein
MKKLRLDIEALDVETFDTTEAEPKEKGTVFANSLNPNCGHTPDTVCLYSGDGCIPWSQSPYCDPTYTCNTATDCTYAQ